MDEELRDVLDRVKLRILEEAGRARCCRLDQAVEPGHDVVDPHLLLKLLKGCRVVVVMFYSPTCPYCKALTPIFLDMADYYRDRAAFVRVNVYRHPQLASYYGVMGVPTVIFFMDGRPVTGFSGLIDPERFEAIVEEVLERAGCRPLTRAEAPA